MSDNKGSYDKVGHLINDQNYNEGLNHKEKTIIDFILKNPGVTKQKVVDALDGKFSRVIVFNIIKELERYDILIIKKHKPNSQIHKLYINEHNKILVELNKLSHFEELIITLLEKITNEEIKAHSLFIDDTVQMNEKLHTDELVESIHNSIKHGKITPSDGGKQILQLYTSQESLDSFNRLKICRRMILELFRIFWKVLQAYTIRTTFIWPLRQNNKASTKKLIRSVLDRLIHIQVKIAEAILYISGLEDRYSKSKGFSVPIGVDMYDRMLNTLIKESNIVEYKYSRNFKLFQEYGWGKETEDLVSIINSITENMYMTFQGFTPTIEWVEVDKEDLDEGKTKRNDKSKKY